jgi:hypothetical protein
MDMGRGDELGKIFYFPTLSADANFKNNTLLAIMKLRIISVTFSLLLLLGWSCTFHNVDDDVKPVQIVDPCDTMAVSFADTIFPIFTKYCSNNANGDCHWTGAPTSKPDYTTYAGIKLKVDQGRIQARLFDHNPSAMPPSYSLGPKEVSACDQTLITRWIGAGAPNN